MQLTDLINHRYKHKDTIIARKAWQHVSPNWTLTITKDGILEKMNPLTVQDITAKDWIYVKNTIDTEQKTK